MTESELMWIVGFWEGEGTAGFLKAGKQGRRLMASISQKHPDIIHWLQDTIGLGHFSKVLNQGINKGTIYRWNASDKQARTFLRMIVPHTKSQYKRSQALKALHRDSQNINTEFHTPPEEKEEIERYLLQKVPARYVVQHFDRNLTTIYKYKRELGL